jgi:hypothetical protein
MGRSPSGGRQVAEKQARSFFEKKEPKKLLLIWMHGHEPTGQHGRKWTKVFLVLFFQKKNGLLTFALPC